MSHVKRLLERFAERTGPNGITLWQFAGINAAANNTLAEIAAADYFLTDWDRLSVGDQILCRGTDGTQWREVVTSSSAGVTTKPSAAGDIIDATVTWNPGSLAAGDSEIKQVTVTGAALGDYVQAAAPYDLQGLVLSGYVQAADTVELALSNPGTLLVGSATWDAGSIADGDEEVAEVTVTGAALGDKVVGVSLSIDVADLALTGHVTGPDTVTVQLLNNTGDAIDLASATVTVHVQDADGTVDLASGTFKLRVSK